MMKSLGTGEKNSTSLCLREGLQLVSQGTELEQNQLGDWAPLTKAIPGTRLRVGQASQP